MPTPPTRFAISVLVVLLSVLPPVLVTPAAAQGRPPVDREAAAKARLLGALLRTSLAVDLEAVPARDAFDRLSRALGITIIVRADDDAAGHGIDPDVPITMKLDRGDGLLVLEMMLEQCEVFEPCTWQLRRGFVEVGTKERLAAPAAAETRSYPIRDLMLEPPYYVPDVKKLLGSGHSGSLGVTAGGLGSRARGGMSHGVRSVADFDGRPYATAVLSRPAELVYEKFGWSARKNADELAEEIIQAIVQTIEPGNWDTGEPVEGAVDDEVRGRRDPAPRPGHVARGRRSNRIARLRRLDELLIITAPDFIHREVDGYPAPIAPRPLSADERRQRTDAASGPACRLEVLADSAEDARGVDRRPAPGSTPDHLVPPGGERRR